MLEDRNLDVQRSLVLICYTDKKSALNRRFFFYKSSTTCFIFSFFYVIPKVILIFYNFVLSDTQDPSFLRWWSSIFLIIRFLQTSLFFHFYPQTTPQICIEIYLLLILTLSVHPLALRVFQQNNQRDACRLFYLSAFCGIVAICGLWGRKKKRNRWYLVQKQIYHIYRISATAYSLTHSDIRPYE